MSRSEQILRMLTEQGMMGVKDLALAFSVNVSTIRRDLDRLAKEGKVSRTHGGVSIASGSLRSAPVASVQTAIGHAMANRILENQTVLIDSGDTCVEVARAINNERLTVVTNNFRVADVIALKSQINLVFIGGELLPNGSSTWGPTSVNQVENIRVDVSIFGAAAVSSDGIYSRSSYLIELRRKMMAVSNEAFFVAESIKFGREALFKVFDFDGFTAGVSDDGLDPLTAAQWPIPIIRASR